MLEKIADETPPAAAAKQVVTSVSEQKKEDWMNSKWRPMMGWMYMLVCTMDMVVFPILWSLLQTFTHTQITQWNPLTLQGAGLFHIAMGAVLGIAAFGRTQEKLGGANNGGIQFPSGAGTTYVPPGQGQANISNQSSSFGSPGFGGATTTGFGAPAQASSFASAPPAFGAKPLGPPPAAQPLL